MISTISRTSIVHPDDFYDCFDLSGECNGITFLLCQDFLIYPESDRLMAEAVDARELLDYAGPGSVWTLTASNRAGIYLRTYADIYGYDGVFHSTDINNNVLENLKPYLALGGEKANCRHGEQTADNCLLFTKKAVYLRDNMLTLASYNKMFCSLPCPGGV